MRISVILVLGTLIISSAACSRQKEEIRYYNQMIPVSRSEVSNFIDTLPLFLRLSQDIKKGVNQQKNEEEMYREYLKKLSSDPRFQASILEGRFRDLEHYMLVSFNIYQAHSYIRKMGADYSTMMKQTYGSLLKKKTEIDEMLSQDQEGIDTNLIEYRKVSLENEFMLYSNMTVIKPYVTRIDSVKLDNQ